MPKFSYADLVRYVSAFFKGVLGFSILFVVIINGLLQRLIIQNVRIVCIRYRRNSNLCGTKMDVFQWFLLGRIGARRVCITRLGINVIRSLLCMVGVRRIIHRAQMDPKNRRMYKKFIRIISIVFFCVSVYIRFGGIGYIYDRVAQVYGRESINLRREKDIVLKTKDNENLAKKILLTPVEVQGDMKNRKKRGDSIYGKIRKRTLFFTGRIFIFKLRKGIIGAKFGANRAASQQYERLYVYDQDGRIITLTLPVYADDSSDDDSSDDDSSDDDEARRRWDNPNFVGGDNLAPYANEPFIAGLWAGLMEDNVNDAGPLRLLR
jgi:hypothetical protein